MRNATAETRLERDRPFLQTVRLYAEMAVYSSRGRQFLIFYMALSAYSQASAVLWGGSRADGMFLGMSYIQLNLLITAFNVAVATLLTLWILDLWKVEVGTTDFDDQEEIGNEQ